MKKILLLSTGGTIASREGGNGLAPSIQPDELLGFIKDINLSYQFDYEDLLNLDSSNIQPEEWQIIARRVFKTLDDYDGVLITHGTDTMAYTASALSFMLRNLGKSVVLTGSQLPIESPLTDAKTNLYTAIAAIDSGIRGVTVAFDRKVINGARAVKVSTVGFDAFESVNAAFLGQLYADGMRVSGHQSEFDSALPTLLQDKICTDVFLLKLIPGTNPAIFDALAGMKYRGIVIEAFGAGGMHYINRDLLSRLQMLSEAGIVVVVCSQCLYEQSDLSLYEVGQRIMREGVLSGRDMTTEAAVTKLMWSLGQESDFEKAKKLFAENISGEFNPDVHF